jgi:hypothetical protein
VIYFAVNNALTTSTCPFSDALQMAALLFAAGSMLGSVSNTFAREISFASLASRSISVYNEVVVYSGEAYGVPVLRRVIDLVTSKIISVPQA